MKTLFSIVLVLLPIGAQASECGMIQDHDTRAMCYAHSMRSASQCGLIYDNDTRRFCREQSGDRR